MKRLKISTGVVRTVILVILAGGLFFLGILAGGLGTSYLFLSDNVKQREAKQRDWLGDDLYNVPCSWCYLKVDANGWSATSIDNLLQLKELINTSDKELVIPIFPTVYTPSISDVLYYNTILESDIEQGDKVLVIGAGSGSDAWAAWLKSQSLVYVIEVNPMGIANINTTARLGNFQVKSILGDIRDIDMPEDFSNFDFVLWNMPYLWPKEEGKKLENRNCHDGDDGSILKSFLSLLPSLLKKDGQVIILNTPDALEFIKFPNLTTKGDGNVLVYIFSNDTD
jgi:tRNA1(Val) A37 N6-methylase TrmN6